MVLITPGFWFNPCAGHSFTLVDPFPNSEHSVIYFFLFPPLESILLGHLPLCSGKHLNVKIIFLGFLQTVLQPLHDKTVDKNRKKITVLQKCQHTLAIIKQEVFLYTSRWGRNLVHYYRKRTEQHTVTLKWNASPFLGAQNAFTLVTNILKRSLILPPSSVRIILLWYLFTK